MSGILKTGGCTLFAFILASNLNLKQSSNTEAVSMNPQEAIEARKDGNASSAIESRVLNKPETALINNLANIYSKADCCNRQNKFLINLIDKNMPAIENNAEISKAVANALYETAARHLSQIDNKKATVMDYAPAIKMLETATKLQPENYDVLIELGWAYRKIDKNDSENSYFERKGMKAHFKAAALCEKARACQGKMPFIANSQSPTKPAFAKSKYINKHKTIYIR